MSDEEASGQPPEDLEPKRQQPASDESASQPKNWPVPVPQNSPGAGLEMAAPRNTPVGRVQVASLTERAFEAQRRKFDRLGYSQGPTEPTNDIGDKEAAKALGSAAVHKEIPQRQIKKPRLPRGDPADVDAFLGPWAGYQGESIGHVSGPTEEEMSAYLHAKARAAPPARSEIIKLGEEQSIFHGKAERDYLGRTFMHPPPELATRKDAGSFECFAPKRLLHTWFGHTKGVNAIRFIPRTGHLLLSASQDTRIKIWETHGERQCLRTFLGHNKPVRDICFDWDGTRFASCAYDKTVKYWDTETGKCLMALEHTAIPYCVRVHPDADKSHIVLAGTSDNRIMQWDMRTGQVIQEYNQHLDAVNSITFFDDNKRFVSSSDDKALRVWDYDIPVTVKYIADPSMHSMPCAMHHPTEPFILFQSLNNRILVYSVQGRLQLRHKKFVGHSTAGYAIQMGASPDGKYIVSGDGRGQLVVWDWKSSQIARRLEAHKDVCISAQWNPQEPSRVATCSWDGTIKYWD